MAQTFVEVADTLVANFDLVDLHTLVAARCVEIFDVDAAGLVIAAPNGDLRITASSDEEPRTVDLLDMQASEGPGRDCFHSGEPVVNQDLAGAEVRWPRFVPLALGYGIATAHALPMRLRDQVIGALNLFQMGGALGRPDVDGAQALADIATIAILKPWMRRSTGCGATPAGTVAGWPTWLGT